jgi:MFS family permease
VSAVLCFVATVMMRVLFRESRMSESIHGSPSRPAHMGFRSAVALPSFGAMAAVMFFANFVERSFSPVVALYVLQLGTDAKDAAKIAGMIISLGLLSEAISASLMGNRLRKTSAKTLLLWRLAGGVVACLPMGLVWRASQFLVLRLVLGFLAGGCMVIVYTLAGLTIPRETRGTSFSILASAAMLGGAAGPVVAGELAYVSLRAIFFFNAFVFLLLLVYSWKTVRQIPRGAIGMTFQSPEKPA